MTLPLTLSVVHNKLSLPRFSSFLIRLQIISKGSQTSPKDSQYVSRDSVFSPSPCFIHVLPRLPTRLSTTPLQKVYDLPTTFQTLPVRTEPTDPQASPWKEFNVLGFESPSTHEEVNWMFEMGFHVWTSQASVFIIVSERHWLWSRSHNSRLVCLCFIATQT